MIKNKKKNRLLHFSLGLIIFLSVISIAGILIIKSRNIQVSYTPSNLKLSNESLGNPYCGWFHKYYYDISEDYVFDSSSVDFALAFDNMTSLCLLDINLGKYADTGLSEHAISEIRAVLSAWSASDKQLILRFDYGDSDNGNFREPGEISTVYLHMEQLAPIIKEYMPNIYVIQGALTGDDGDSTQSAYSSSENISDLTYYFGSLLNFASYMSVVDSSLYKSVNKIGSVPAGLTADNPLRAQNLYSMPYRLGIFNHDISPLTDEKIINDIQSISTWAPVGGIAGKDNSMHDVYNAISALSDWHVSYLSADESAATIDSWKNTTYHGDDIFDGVTGYDYMTSHLGYRYVINSSDLTFNPMKDDVGKITIEVENTGFASTFKSFETSLVLKNTDTEELIKIPLDTDTSTWYPNHPISLTSVLDIRSYTRGNFNIYLLLIDPATGQTIKLGNDIPLTSEGYMIAKMHCAP